MSDKNIKYKVYSVDTDVGENPAVICDDQKAARKAACDILFDPDNTPPLDKEEKKYARSLLKTINDTYPIQIPGSAAWKEFIYVVPYDDNVGATA